MTRARDRDFDLSRAPPGAAVLHSQVMMGMFDSYRPSRPLACPGCGLAIPRWQGKEGPCALFVWKEGTAWPIGQDVDDELQLPISDRQRKRLPKVFTIYSYDCPRHQPVKALCSTDNDVWMRTEVQPWRDVAD